MVINFVISLPFIIFNYLFNSHQENNYLKNKIAKEIKRLN